MITRARDGSDEENWDEEDWDDRDDNEHEGDTIPCPYCKREIYEDAPRCPYCERYISAEDRAGSSKPMWMIVTAVLLLISLVGGYLVFFLAN